jgi:ATP-dependent Clp protease adaptor protein ClpS
VGQTIELPRTQEPGTGLGGRWRVIVRNDDHNTFDHVAHTLARFHPRRHGRSRLRRGRADPQHGERDRLGGLREPAELYWQQLADAGLTMAPLEQG